MSDSRHKCESISLEEATIYNMWEITAEGHLGQTMIQGRNCRPLFWQVNCSLENHPCAR